MVRWSLCVVVTALSLSPAPAQTMLGAADILDTLPSSIPLSEARAVALVPRGPGPSPQGVLFVKGEDGWGEPEVVTLRGIAPRGARETPDIVLLFRTRRSAERVARGDGRIEPDVNAYAFSDGAFVPFTLDGAVLRKSGPFAGSPDRKLVAELKAQLTRLTSPKSDPTAKSPVPIDWVRLLGHSEVLMGGFAMLGAWLALLKRRKR